jgi:glycosyltransferase involved in cell wall biosynthesis
MLKVFISPNFPNPDKAEGGIRRVVTAMRKHLPSYGIEIVNHPDQADVINTHAMEFVNQPYKPLVHSNHGLYWDDYKWPPGLLFANQEIINIMTRAQAITAPSKWVAHALSRGIMTATPKAIYHGVDMDEWSVGENQGYVLWNKARADIVSNPADMQELASLMPDVGFVTTIGKKSPNVQVTGVVPYGTMKQMIRNAGVYLATARETFGIGTLEALACGVPVAGWDYGGQSEIIIQGKTGYLAPPGDYEALAECVRKCFAEREKLSKNALADIKKRWQWKQIIKQYADLFKRVYTDYHQKRPLVSIIITAYNLAKYLPQCLASVENQTGNWECIIVDDCSTDDTEQVAKEFIKNKPRFKYIKPEKNLKLSGARNFGVVRSIGKYIIPLDADDMLATGALDTLSHALDGNPGIHIAYGRLEFTDETGNDRRRGDWPKEFNWFQQMAHLNQLPYCSMMRREVLENTGGYRIRDWRNEDAAFWCYVTAYGFRAKKVTDDTTFIYRLRQDSKIQTERKNGGEGDWTAWYPWRLGAMTPQQGFDLIKKGASPSFNTVPFGAQGEAPGYCWPIHSHHDPVVSVIIPVGPRHGEFLVDALDSVQAQMFPFWEAIVINDSGEKLPYAPAWARVIETEGGTGAGNARNLGVVAARSPLVLFLDTDDILMPTAIYEMIEAYIEADGAKYIYTDWFSLKDDGITPKYNKSSDYTRNGKGIHAVTVLIEKQWVDNIGGFDAGMGGWEDWDFILKLAIAGYCGQRLEKPLFYYRTLSGSRRSWAVQNSKELGDLLTSRYDEYFGKKRSKELMGCCGGSNSGDIILQAKSAYSKIRRVGTERQETRVNGMTRMEYIGTNKGAVNTGVAPSGKNYRGGNSTLFKFTNANPEDVHFLELTGRWKKVYSEVSVDLSKMNRKPPDLPQPVTAEVFKPEPVREVVNPDDSTISELKKTVLGYNTEELKRVLYQEKAGKNRKSAIKFLETMIYDAERVANGLLD